MYAKNIRRHYGVPIWFSARTSAGQDVPFARLLFFRSQRSQRHSADPFLSYRTANGLTCLLYADIKKAVKDSAAIFGLDKAWFDTHSVRMSARSYNARSNDSHSAHGSMADVTSSHEASTTINTVYFQWLVTQLCLLLRMFDYHSCWRHVHPTRPQFVDFN